MQGGFVAFYNSKIKIFYRLTSGLFLSESKLGSLREKSFRIALFFYLSVVIGRENLCLPLNQSATELNQVRPAHRRFLALYAGCLFPN